MTDLGDLLPRTPEPVGLGFTFDLGESGWASLRISLGPRTFLIPSFGHMTDGLGDLVRAALQIATGDQFAGIIFDEEPQRWGFAIEPAGLSPDNRRIMRVTLRDGGKQLSDAGWSNKAVWQWAAQPVLEGYVSSDDFARAVLAVTASARERYSDEVYRERWGYHGSLEGFPLRGLKALEAALRTPEYREGAVE